MLTGSNRAVVVFGTPEPIKDVSGEYMTDTDGEYIYPVSDANCLASLRTVQAIQGSSRNSSNIAG